MWLSQGGACLFFLPVSQRAPGNLFAWTVRVEVNRKPGGVTASCGATGAAFGLGRFPRRVLTAGTRSFLTSSTALLILISALACESSTVIRTWRSSFRCSQFGLPLFCSSCVDVERRE